MYHRRLSDEAIINGFRRGDAGMYEPMAYEDTDFTKAEVMEQKRTTPEFITSLEPNEGTDIIYIGKAGGSSSKATLRSRLIQYLKFGMGMKVGHWGGRYIWQLANSDSLIICWKSTKQDARDVESEMIEQFKREHNGCRPFANLKD